MPAPLGCLASRGRMRHLFCLSQVRWLSYGVSARIVSHTDTCISFRHHSCATLDYLGISSLISSSILTLTHQGFRCRRTEDFAYNTTTCLIGALGLYLPWKEWFNKRGNKNYRIAFFLAMSGAGAAPLIHFAGLFGIKDTWKFYSALPSSSSPSVYRLAHLSGRMPSAGPVLYSLVAYVLGLLFYAFDFPEKVRPGGLFDTVSGFHVHYRGAVLLSCLC